MGNDFAAEAASVNDADKIFHGMHSFGIVEYTHYPNGSSYILIPFLAMGVPNQWLTLRLIPLITSACAVAIFSFIVLLQASNLGMKIWFIFFTVVLLNQPAFFAWQGALHEFSFFLSITFLLVAISSHQKLFKHGLVWIIGFFSGWLGYDFLPLQFFAIITIRCLIYGNDSHMKLSSLLLMAFYDGFVFLSGVTTAILSHLFQNFLYFSDFDRAVRDLLGSASIRMGIGDPKAHATGFAPSFIGTIDPFWILSSMLESFLHGTWSSWGQGVVYDGQVRWSNPTSVILVIALSYLFSLLKIANNNSNEVYLRRVFRSFLLLVIVTFGVVCSSVAWFFLMRNHAATHLIYLPRHFLVGFILIGVIPILFLNNKIRAQFIIRSYKLLKSFTFSIPFALMVFVLTYYLVLRLHD
ncbi:MAG: hypothetical protein LHV69_05060 [Elusimicrobia bacterium]|nr:hypothetical protein [Candidatus Obscuribacterium magneticum]